ncbi:MAG: hypothetical protein JO217_14925 [Acidobacteriaceae bacterium]|nr:hypothetical protein [Acidobacteriaceae bacterium]MBV9443974.1 hypothetical protein [Acidobacteriaceae bacterium]
MNRNCLPRSATFLRIVSSLGSGQVSLWPVQDNSLIGVRVLVILAGSGYAPGMLIQWFRGEPLDKVGKLNL